MKVVMRRGERPLEYSGEARHAPPATAKGTRAHAYAFEVPEALARVLVRSRRCDPAFTGDQERLQRMGVTCRCVFGSEPKAKATTAPVEPVAASKTEDAPAQGDSPNDAAGDEPGPTSHELVRTALATRRKPDLLVALDAAGINGSTLTNNGQREGALRLWMEVNADQEREG